MSRCVLPAADKHTRNTPRSDVIGPASQPHLHHPFTVYAGGQGSFNMSHITWHNMVPHSLTHVQLLCVTMLNYY